MKKALISLAVGVVFTSVTIIATVATSNAEAEKWARVCDGKTITSSCSDKDGKKYDKYIYHEAVEEVTKVVEHPATPAKTHTVNHPAQYGTRYVAYDCVRTTISYKRGTCALSQCWDGQYSGSTGWGTCNYHGGVYRSGGPWYKYRQETYLIKNAWTETVVDVPAKAAWKETVVVTPAKEAYYEKVVAARQ